jgi:hypothetical protein
MPLATTVCERVRVRVRERERESERRERKVTLLFLAWHARALKDRLFECADGRIHVERDIKRLFAPLDIN